MSIIIPDGGTIGSTSDTDAISIASDGNVTLSQTNPTITLGSNATFPTGHILQVKASQTSSQSTVSVSTTPTALGLSIDITPTSSSNTIIVHGCVYIGQSNFNGGLGIGRHLTSDSFSDSATKIGSTGASDDTYIRAGNFFNADDSFAPNTHTVIPIPFTYYDNSYSTTNSITYTVYGESSGTYTYYFNRANSGATSGIATSFIWAYEVKGSVT